MNNPTHIVISDGLPKAEPCIIQSAFQFDNGRRIIVYTGSLGIKSFECDENWKPCSKPFGECPLEWSGKKTATEYHLHLRNVVHKKEDFMPEHSTVIDWVAIPIEQQDSNPDNELIDFANAISMKAFAELAEQQEQEEGMPDFDGDYLCFIEKIEECGAINKLWRVVKCDNNQWKIEKNEKVLSWQVLPEENKWKISVAGRDKPFFVDTFRKLLNQYDREEISISKFVECLNIEAFKWHQSKEQPTPQAEEEEELWREALLKYETLRQMEENDFSWNIGILKQSFTITRKQSK